MGPVSFTGVVVAAAVEVELEVAPGMREEVEVVEMESVDDEREVDEEETDETDDTDETEETEEVNEVDTVDEDTVEAVETLVELEDGATELEDTTGGIESGPGVYLVRS